MHKNVLTHHQLRQMRKRHSHHYCKLLNMIPVTLNCCPIETIEQALRAVKFSITTPSTPATRTPLPLSNSPSIIVLFLSQPRIVIEEHSQQLLHNKLQVY